MNKEILNKSLQVEQLEDRFEMTTIAADADRCSVMISAQSNRH
ncbi:MAG: hypothetical protein R2795_13615 [Saprospiraceae bacterium]